MEHFSVLSPQLTQLNSGESDDLCEEKTPKSAAKWEPGSRTEKPGVKKNQINNHRCLEHCTENVHKAHMDDCIMCIREKSMCLDKEDVVQVKDAFKWAVQGLVGKELGASVLTKVSASLANVTFTTLVSF